MASDRLVDVFANFFPPNSKDSWLFGPELPWFNENEESGRSDLVLSQSLSTWPENFNAFGLPFLAAEFKSAGSGKEEWDKAFAQLDGAVKYLAKWWSRGQPLFGVTALGNFCAFYKLENGKLVRVHAAEKLSMADANDRKTIGMILEDIRKVSPAPTAKFQSAAPHL
ncbi:hypothetical protein B0T26DRAFT_747780 [Lasiosphaeria miniovina]|uniref:Uncharacterized protein n=1 Tax=Lasiosphaeria miniovina TaxID=1954250 RepID=A0AA40B4M7_9PEZI|nr:uncharacterized protein B0T26DRAFT_747780 [Lasiosphaeria miniovina]KAK0727457.1 hypothetical protein B0T26DRAFT_747780 [Lasiosphaeria miniovina]